jgi:transposase-like protein
MFAFGNGCKKYARLTDKFVIGRGRIKEIFVDETLLKVDGQNCWLWLAYDEPNRHLCLVFHLSLEKEPLFYAISSSLDR